MRSAAARQFETETDPGSIGERLKTLRQEKDMTLTVLAKRSGISASTLSKIENDKVSPTFANLLKIAAAHGVPLARLIGDTTEQQVPSTGRIAVTRAQDIVFTRTQTYDMGPLCSELRNKRMSPFLDSVRSSATNVGDRLVRHPGEEFVYVLEGDLEIHTEHYAPIRLGPGDSAYFDSSMAHAFRSAGERPTRMLMVWLPPDGSGAEGEKLFRQINLLDGIEEEGAADLPEPDED